MSGMEKKFSRFLVEKLRTAGWMVQPIESTETACGIPDLYLCKEGRSLWMELKVVPVAWPTKQRLPFRPGQYGWLHSHEAHGGRSVVGVKCMNGFVFAHCSDVDKEFFNVINKSSICFMSILNLTLLERWLLN